jgi:apolipoprotein N-acyltransferase
LCLWQIIFGTLIYFTVKKPVHLFALPFFWVSLEWTKQFGSLAFPWELLGYSQYQNLHMIQIADCLGIYGVSFLIMLINVCLFIVLLFLMNRQWQQYNVSKSLMLFSFMIAVIAIAATLIYGAIQISQTDNAMASLQHKSIMTVQPAIPQQEKWQGENRISITQKMVQLTYTGHKKPTDMVVWPETALPYAFHSKHNLRLYVLNAVKQMHVALLVGSPTFLNRGDQLQHYNSALLIDKEGNIKSRYDKVKLVPFSEYMPFPTFRNLWRSLGAPDNKFSSGNEGKILELNEFQMGIQICFEIIFPKYARTMVKNGANVLINISNDAWFGRTACPYQHFSMAVFRAVENKRALIRCANTGISGMIDPCGRIVSQSKLFETNTMIHHVPLIHTKTIYSKWGDFFAKIALLLSLGYVVMIRFQIIKDQAPTEPLLVISILLLHFKGAF